MFKIEYIVDRRKNKDNQQKYLIKWKDYSKDKNSQKIRGTISVNTLQEFQKRFKIKPRRSIVSIIYIKRGCG